MRVTQRADGLYVFQFEVRFRSTVRKLNGLIDTGSNVCAGTFNIFTALRARPSSFDKIGSPFSSPIRYLGYSLKLTIDGKSVMTTVYRLPMKMPGIDLILGHSILKLCKINTSGAVMDLAWMPIPSPPRPLPLDTHTTLRR